MAVDGGVGIGVEIGVAVGVGVGVGVGVLVVGVIVTDDLLGVETLYPAPACSRNVATRLVGRTPLSTFIVNVAEPAPAGIVIAPEDGGE